MYFVSECVRSISQSTEYLNVEKKMTENVKTLMRHIVTGSLVLWLVTLSGSALSETVTDYFPLADGNTWTYRVTGPNGTYNITILVVPRTARCHGQWVKKLRITGGPDVLSNEFWTNDTNGIRLHCANFPTIVFEPPAIIANSTMDIHETVNSTGKVILPAYGYRVIDYEYTSTIQGVETVTVPAGTFETIRLRNTSRVYGSINGKWVDEKQTDINWVAKHIGPIKVQYSVDSEEAVLISTNVRPPPPFLPFLPLLLDQVILESSFV